MKTMSCLALALILLAHPTTGAAAPRGGREQSAIRQTLAQYPEETREAACAVAAHPELLVRLARIQQQSSGDFAEVLGPYSRQDQEALWELARFPGLMAALAEVDHRDDEQLNQVLDQYPAQIAPLARKWARRDTRVLAEIAALNQRAEASSASLLSAYPARAQEQARLLLQSPELVEMLVKDLDQVVLLGDAYRQDPEALRQQLAQLPPQSAGLARRAKRPVADDEEPERATASRGRRYDYDLNGLDDPEAQTQVEVVYHRNYYQYPYPYWFGYPSWCGPSGWYAGFNWRLTPNVSASIGIEVPVVRWPVPVYRPYGQRRSEGNWHPQPERGHGKRRHRRH
ncbi:MAG: hypothetical protein IT369_01300 [Candidatus Latescibacteria bacterium]|nr:hypothetical protein [Candidatus Latescibacterota bacterium]